MDSPTAEFRPRVPGDIPPNPKTGGAPFGNMPKDTPAKELAVGKAGLPAWAKWVIGCNLVMVHAVIVMAGLEQVPFSLGDAALAAYVITGLGLPVGLSGRAVRRALSDALGLKS